MMQNRRLSLGGSDAAVVCGLSPFKTPLELWMEKTGRIDEQDISGINHVKFGTFFEEGVARWFEAESGIKVNFTKIETLTHPEFPWMTGNIDYLIVGENAFVECKTAGSNKDWLHGAPLYYKMQVAHYMAVGKYDRCYVAVVFANTREMEWFTIDRDLEFEAELIAKERHFWEHHVQKDIEPPITTPDDILLFYKDTAVKPAIADARILEMIREIKGLDNDIETRLDLRNALKEKVQLHMLNSESLVDSNGSVLATWKYTKPVAGFDKKRLTLEMPEIAAKYATVGERQRRFKIAGAKDE